MSRHLVQDKETEMVTQFPTIKVVANLPLHMLKLGSLSRYDLPQRRGGGTAVLSEDIFHPLKLSIKL